MDFFKRHPLFSLIIALFAVLILAEGWYLYQLRGDVGAAEADVRRRISEIEALQRQKPTPSNENLRIARDDFAQSAEILTNMLRLLNVTGPDDLDFFKGEPTTRPDAWFEISQFVDRMTNEAGKNNVELKADERFGFSAFAFEGPEPAYIRSVYRQHRIVEYLLTKLFAARPRELIGVQREQPQAVVPEASGPDNPAAGATAAPAPAPRPPGGTPASGVNAPSEIFVIDPQVSARAPGYVDTLAFRVVFSGQTTALRGFMNALAAPDIPLVVRSVEVAEHSTSARESRGTTAAGSRPRPPTNPFSRTPATSDEAATPAMPNAAVPIVPENVSVFTVTVELFDVKIRAPQVTATAANP